MYELVYKDSIANGYIVSIIRELEYQDNDITNIARFREYTTF
jgi:hypothetical protein